MERRNFKLEDKKVEKNIDYIYKNALGNPVILKSTPGKDDLKSNNLGVYGTDIYVKTADGKMIKLTGAEII